MIATSSTLETLLASVTHEEWFDYLPVIHDAYLDLGDEDAAEAVRWLMENWKRPLLYVSEYKGSFSWGETAYLWDRPEGDLPIDEFELEDTIVNVIDRVNKPQKPKKRTDAGFSDTIGEQLTGFVAAWKEGHRP